MIIGQCKVVKYYPMFPRSFEIMRKEMPKQCNLTNDQLEELKEAKECEDLYSIMKKDFWITTPCYSFKNPDSPSYEGTRLTIQLTGPEIYEYSIRTPGTPPRWKQYENELDHIYQLLTTECTKPEIDMDKVSDLILAMTFFWYNFMPLSRGTAAVGYMGLLAMFLANDIEITEKVPLDFQVDWEGILTPRHQDFISSVSKWLYPSRKQNNFLQDLPSVAEVYPTIRKIIEALNTFTNLYPREIKTETNT